ncbi:MAG: DUF4129 domain-containing protein [Phycisphaerae bacterium]
MAGQPNKQDARGALDLLEEAAHALRTAGGGAIACYYVGALPMVLAALYFWADMSAGAFAELHLIPAALALAMLLVWMKCWQSVYMRMVLDQLCGSAGRPWTWRRVLRLAAVQAAIQPWGLFIIPLAAVVVVPLPWAYATFQNASLLGDGDEPSTARSTLTGSWEMATLWAGQNVAAMLILSLLVAVVMFNLAQSILLPAWLLKTFLDVETVFSRGGFNASNTTFLAIIIALTYLCVDPMIKAFYTLRCFYGRSLKTGEDLQASMRQVLARKRPVAAMVAVLAAVLATSAPPAHAAINRDAPYLSGEIQINRVRPYLLDVGGRAPFPVAGLVEQPPGASPGKVAPEQLDESIGRVINRSDYAWRMPRPAAEKATGDSFLARLAKWLDDLREELRKRREKDRGSSGSGGPGGQGPLVQPGAFAGWAGAAEVLMYILCAVAIAAIIAVIHWAIVNRARDKDAKDAKADEAEAKPDLEDEDVTPQSLPPDGWLDLARQMMQRGDRRLALRALYLASLALLAQRDVIRIARYKSNRQYQAEVQRRGHSMPQVVEAFGHNVDFFEDAWYGMHEVTDPIVKAFLTNQQAIKALESQRA